MIFRETTLVTEYEKLQFLIQAVNQSFGYGFTCKLLYRASRDGWQSTEFHRLCDEKGPTVVLVKVDNGRLCGGYCSIGWKSSGDMQQDDKSFLFSLDSLKSYNGIQQGHIGHVFWNRGNGPWFGEHGSLGLHATMNQPNSSYCRINRKSLTVPGDSQG